ncbi:MAG: 3-dehydroquinate synthase [Salinivirgaceae bacterium]|nr:3-dehydroquinate synthase [Salinivirgaceae bacterium]
MEKVYIKGSQSESLILIGESFKTYKKYLPNKKVIVLTDEKVGSFYNQYFQEYPIIEIGQTEKNKNLKTIDFILTQLIELNADRSTFLLAVGGGIVCDIAGFVASIYLRGIDFAFISTTLLSQVDASVGGKNGVNFQGFKNILGVFNQPKFVICDPVMLKTLETNELNSGFAEIVKHTLIDDKPMFEKLEKDYSKALNLDETFINALVSNSVKIKAGIVNKDEKEKGERRKLNLGHTYGHAIEKLMGISHGNAVSIGLMVAAKLSFKLGYLSQDRVFRIEKLLNNLNLPTSVSEKQAEILDALIMDKKRENSQIHFVLLKDIGEVFVKTISIEELKTIEL